MKEKYAELQIAVLSYLTIMGFNDEESEKLYNDIFDRFEKLECFLQNNKYKI